MSNLNVNLSHIFWVDLGVVDFGGGFQLDSVDPKLAQVDS